MSIAIYRDYMFKQSIPDLLIEVLSIHKNLMEDLEILKTFSVYTFFAIRTSKIKIFYSILINFYLHFKS